MVVGPLPPPPIMCAAGRGMANFVCRPSSSRHTRTRGPRDQHCSRGRLHLARNHSTSSSGHTHQRQHRAGAADTIRHNYRRRRVSFRLSRVTTGRPGSRARARPRLWQFARNVLARPLIYIVRVTRSHDSTFLPYRTFSRSERSDADAYGYSGQPYARNT